jgi:hypothetical protein
VKRLLLLILPCILAGCGSASPGLAAGPTATNGQMDTQAPGLAATKLFQLTAEMETVTAGYPKNDATITAIMANKHALGTAMSETMTAMPTETPVPTIPADSPFCRTDDLKTSFQSMGATQSILLGAGLTNISNTPCFLQAWPQAELVDQQGRPLDVDYNYFEMGPGDAVSAATEQARDTATARVGVWPGWTTWLNLIWMNWCGTPISGGAVIRLRLWGNAGMLVIQTGLQTGGTCNAPGYRSSISIAKFPPASPSQ